MSDLLLYVLILHCSVSCDNTGFEITTSMEVSETYGLLGTLMVGVTRPAVKRILQELWDEQDLALSYRVSQRDDNLGSLTFFDVYVCFRAAVVSDMFMTFFVP